MPAEGHEIRVVDTLDPYVLTTEEIAELKRLAAMSRAARIVMAFVIGAISLLGAGHLMDLISRYWK